MSTPSILCIAIGLLIIATRGPLLIAPRATLHIFNRVVATNTRVRGIALVLVPLSAALLVLPLGEGLAAQMLYGFGIFCAGATLWLLIAPGTYRRFARSVLDVLDSSVDTASLRFIGVLGVTIGGALIYAGIFVV